jgi:phosphoesterase RecJ-like protein
MVQNWRNGKCVSATSISIYHDWSSSKPDDYAAVTYSDTAFGSTLKCFIILSNQGKKADIDFTIGTCIYTGILTDSVLLNFQNNWNNT